MAKFSTFRTFAAALSLSAAVAFGAVAQAQAPQGGGQGGGGAPPAQQGGGQGGQGGGGGGGGPADQWAGKKKLLIWLDVQNGYHHDSINHAAAVVERLGRESGTYVSVIRSDSQLITKKPVVGKGARYSGRGINARNLDQFDAIFYVGAGEGTLDSQQKLDLLSFVKDDGKGLVVGHAAGVAFFDWPEWGNLIGGFMGSEYSVMPMQVIVEDQKFPGVKQYGAKFTFPEQYPVLKEPYVKGKVHTIMRLDWSKLTPEQQARRPDGDIPVVFALPYGKGRVINNGLGHNEATYDDPRFQTMLLEQIKWAMGLTKADIPLDPK